MEGSAIVCLRVIIHIFYLQNRSMMLIQEDEEPGNLPTHCCPQLPQQARVAHATAW